MILKKQIITLIKMDRFSFDLFSDAVSSATTLREVSFYFNDN